MSSVDTRPKPPRSFSDDAVAILRATINSIMDAVDGSIAATGAPPSTEEEALRYNQARDRGVAGAFNAARAFSPVTPGFLGGVIGRGLTGGSSRVAIKSPSPVANARGVSSPSNRYGSEPYLGQPSLPTVSAPSISPQGAVTRSEGLLGRLRELEELERQASIKTAPPATPENEPNFRQLTRVIISKGSEAAGTEGKASPQILNRALSDDDLDIPPFLLRQRPDTEGELVKPKINYSPVPSDGSGGSGGKGGGVGSDSGGYDEDCENQRRKAEKLCMDARAAGFVWKGNKRRWKSDYNTGPYPNGGPSLSAIDDCAKGHIAEECGGGVYERPPEPKIKRYRLR